MMFILRLALALALCCSTSRALAGDRFVVVPWDAIAFEDPPSTRREADFDWRHAWMFDAYVVLDCKGEAFVDYRGNHPQEHRPRQPIRLAVRVAEGETISGRLFLAKPDYSGVEARRFRIPATDIDLGARSAFYEVMEGHYRRLLEHDLPGAAWFRHQADAAHEARGLPLWSPPAQAVNWFAERSMFDMSFDLFTGERALAENLDLDRDLRGLVNEPETIAVSSLAGVKTRALDWKPLVANLKPALDPLAKLIPNDQPALFFPSFEALTRTIDEIDSACTPLRTLFDARTEDQRTKERYQEQLCLPLSGLTRFLGPSVISSIAVTASDPFLPSGTDLALLFECRQSPILEQFVALQQRAAISRGAKAAMGSLGSVNYSGVRSDDRRISSYMAKLADAIVVTNSMAQLERLVDASEGRVAALANADEYVWFRNRYHLGDANETALLVLTDATIRSWVSPRVRIAESRRVRAAAAMAEIQARNLEALVAGTIQVGSSAAASDLPFSSDFTWGKCGVLSPTWGNLNFLTPSSELFVDQATQSEKLSYETFRRGFESRWRTVFDPIAIRLTIIGRKLGVDMTVMPLVANSEYRELIDWTSNSTLGATAGDIHPDTLFHLAMSAHDGPYGDHWFGDGVALYADRDPFWEELLASHSPREFVFENCSRMPVALQIEGEDSRWIENLLGRAGECRSWNGREYRFVHLELGSGGILDGLFYVDLPESLVISFHEDMVQRAIDRHAARIAGKIDPASEQAWLGSNVGGRLESEGVDILERLLANDDGDPPWTSQWSALPILDEWKRRFPAEDPASLHERLWGVRLVSPSGGSFAWNDELHTMETSLYGSPSSPRKGPRLPSELIDFTRAQFGLSFEGEGLRARVELERKQ